MSGSSTPSFRLSSTMVLVVPPSRAKASSCSSHHFCELDLKHKSQTALRLCPSVIAKSRVRRYLPVSGWRTMGPSP